CVASTPHAHSGRRGRKNSPLLAHGACDRRRLLTSVWRGGMTARLIESGLKVFATCPPSYTASPLVYRREVLDIARWSDAAGCEGILVYTDNGLVDPWLIAQDIITHTQRLCPLVAVQPVYMHPYSVAKMVATLGFLHGRRIYLNMAAARQLGALAVRYPKPVAAYEGGPAIDAAALGIRIGIIAREGAAEAWAVARARFPEDRKGQLTHQLAMKVSDSAWHKQLSKIGETATGEDSEQPYWILPFENYKTFCPYLVGSYERVADEVARYVGVGYRTIILDVPASPEELEH